MTTITKDYQIVQKLGDDNYLVLHPETDAGNVAVDVDDVKSKTVENAIKELKNSIDEKASFSDMPDISHFITKAVDDLINYYTKSAIDKKLSDIEGKVSAIPKFSIKVVTEKPTVDISETTIYLISTGNDSENLYTEYIYVNGSWETLGTQTLKLDGYASESWVSSQISDFVTEERVEELIGATAGKVAETANRLSLARKISISGDIIGDTSFDGSKDSNINAVLSNTGVRAGVYSAVEVDEKGRVTAGSQSIEVGTAGQTTPSQNLAVGGLFFKLL